MALLEASLCKICKIIREETPPGVQGGFFNYSKTYRMIEKYKLRQMTGRQIMAEVPGITIQNITRHATKHQTMTEAKAAKVKVSEAALEGLRAEVVELNKRVFSMEQTKGDMSELTDWLMNEVREGRIKGSLGPLVNLLGKQAAISEKEIDQGISMATLMSKYASGEVKQLKAEVPNVDRVPKESGTTDELS